MKKILLVSAALSVLFSSNAFAMCGCFLPPRPPPQMHVADSRLTNKSSKVVMVHDGDRTVVTMSNDFHGDAKEFAIVIPVPTEITKDQIHIGSKDPIEALAQATAPQLLEYPAIDPCQQPMGGIAMSKRAGAPSAEDASGRGSGGGVGTPVKVTVEASYSVGEYDIQMLSATDAEALTAWLKDHGYAVPDRATAVFATYLRMNMHFFVAKANLKAQQKLGYSYLRPIQIAYESPKFMLPIRLGMLNADGDQELTVWAITKKGRVESTNYRTVKMPSGVGMLPEFVKNDFEATYRDIFKNLEKREGNDVIFLEHAGPTGIAATNLRDLGVWWRSDAPAFVSRLHFTYNEEHFPEDLVLQETGDASGHQPVFTVQDSLKSSACMSAFDLRQSQRGQHDLEAQNLARLTGQDVEDIRRRIDDSGDAPMKHKDPDNKKPEDKSWYQNLWK